MMNKALCSLVVVVASGVAGCDAGTDPVGCDFRDGGVNGPEDRCQERRGFQAVGFDTACEGLGGTAVEGGCPVEGRVFGCAIDGGDDVVDFYYAPKTEEDAEIECGSDEIVGVDF